MPIAALMQHGTGNATRPHGRRLARLRRRERREGGAALVEFALVAPLLILLLFGLIEFGMALNDYQSIRQGVRDGARQAVVKQYGSTGTGCTTVAAPDEVKKVICITKDRIGMADDEIAVRVEYFAPTDASDEADHGAVMVCAQKNVDSVTGAVPAVDNVNLLSSIVMKMEKPITTGISTSSAYAETPPSGRDWSEC